LKLWSIVFAFGTFAFFFLVFFSVGAFRFVAVVFDLTSVEKSSFVTYKKKKGHYLFFVNVKIN